MSQYEILSVILACIATIVSLVVWGGQRKIQREANDLQRATSELAKKQLENWSNRPGHLAQAHSKRATFKDQLKISG